jgi:tetratricopeptide (TPR) repeat protein
LLSAFTVAFLAFAGNQGWLDAELHRRVQSILAVARSLIPSEEWIRYLAWLGGIAASAIGAAFTLLASWHFAEMNLPQRLKDLKDAHAREHLSLQPALLSLARSGLGPVVADIETSRITLLRKWLSGWSKKERARILAASAKRLEREALALSAAALASQHEQITAHLIRGYQYASQGDDDKAFEEFEAATRVRADDIVSRDIAAGWARKTNKLPRERELLKELQHAAMGRGVDLDLARALRREAELLDKGQNEQNWRDARDRLNEARNLLQSLLAHDEARLELGRVLTLFCEVQCSRTVVRMLGVPLARMRSYMAGVTMHSRPEEQGGEEYGEARALRAEQRVAELRGDVVAEGDTSDQQ